jgi:hypothetical protein
MRHDQRTDHNSKRQRRQDVMEEVAALVEMLTSNKCEKILIGATSKFMHDWKTLSC